MMISPDGSDDDDHSSSVSLSTAHLDDESLHLSLRPGGLLDKRKGHMDRSRDEGSSNKMTTIAIQTPTEDVVLISSWLNTSKDPVIGNEKSSVAFWKRIAAYFSASPKIYPGERREASHCKQRWHKMNDLVCKFCGAYEAATREKSCGQNENDVLKLAHEIFFTNHKKKFTLEHAWKELRNDQKWCELSSSKNEGSSKRRKFEDGSHSACSEANETDSGIAYEGTTRPTCVKAAKARGKKPMGVAKDMSQFQTMWTIKQQDLAALKEKISKMRLLDSLIAKQDPLAD
ncbi:PREDICTED: glutathione S-transferase T3-like [Brassica oleracea var. oleracea]|uniref:glutathione S-transferase T3-like n=1 Tax=Brassica oleracea var. oleracea TaxID=109376 RepID=UPI0006A74FCE|nr:PREDICTED: glutathione S-transferase T3-like [Brassica oleracea var. oleracea]